MFDVLFPWVTRKRETLALALRTEARVRQLNGLPPAAADTTPGDVMTVLESTNTLLDRVADRPEGLSTVVHRTFHSNNFNMIERYIIRGKAKVSSSLDLTACECLSS